MVFDSKPSTNIPSAETHVFEQVVWPHFISSWPQPLTFWPRKLISSSASNCI